MKIKEACEAYWIDDAPEHIRQQRSTLSRPIRKEDRPMDDGNILLTTAAAKVLKTRAALRSLAARAVAMRDQRLPPGSTEEFLVLMRGGPAGEQLVVRVIGDQVSIARESECKIPPEAWRAPEEGGPTDG
jgi:hypothetical protein